MKVLIVKLAALGDVVMASSMIKALRAKHANCHITWLCGKETYELVSLFKGIDEIICIDNSGLAKGKFESIKTVISVWTQVGFKRYDLVLTCHTDARYGLFTKLTSATDRRMFNGRFPIAGRYHGDEYARLAIGRDGSYDQHYPLADLNIDYATHRDGTILLLPGGAKNIMDGLFKDGAGSALRRLPMETYVELAKKLLFMGRKVAVIGGKSDLWVEDFFTPLGVTSYVGKLSIKQSLELMSGSSMLISHDSGPLHLANIVGLPFVGLFGPVMAAERVFPHQLNMCIDRITPCSPCYDGKNYAKCSSNLCMQRISVPQILDKLLANNKLS